MIIGTKNEEPLLLFVPVTPDAPKYGGTIKKCVRCNAYFGFGEWNYLPLKKNVTFFSHSDTSRRW
jgi:hypothetical protein